MAAMLTLVVLEPEPDRFRLSDVPRAADYATAYVTGTVDIPLTELGDRVIEVPVDSTPVTICGITAAVGLQKSLTSCGNAAILTRYVSKVPRTAG